MIIYDLSKFIQRLQNLIQFCFIRLRRILIKLYSLFRNACCLLLMSMCDLDRDFSWNLIFLNSFKRCSFSHHTLGPLHKEPFRSLVLLKIINKFPLRIRVNDNKSWVSLHSILGNDVSAICCIYFNEFHLVITIFFPHLVYESIEIRQSFPTPITFLHEKVNENVFMFPLIS